MAHGAGIEGFSQTGAQVVIVDDVCTTGGSTLEAIEAARTSELDVIAAVCLVERTEAGGRANVEAALGGAPFFSLFTAEDVRKAHIAQIPL